MSFKCDKYCSHKNHPFIYKLSNEERKCIIKNAKLYIEHNKKYSDKDDLHELNNLKNALMQHFLDNKNNEYFLRLNMLSPKDAYYFINNNTNLLELENIEEIVTEEVIKRNLEYLHVGFPINKIEDHCIKILLHSDRVLCELIYEENEIYVLLLDYKNIDHKSELRCFVKNRKLVAISQYYLDICNVYETPENVISNIINYFNENKITDLESYVFDIYFDNQTINLIEINPFDVCTDPCFLDWSEILGEICKFKYKKNDLILAKNIYNA